MKNIDKVRFSFKNVGWTTLPPGTTFGPRKMEFYQWLWIQQGFCEGEWDGQRQDLPPGSMVFIRPKMTDRYRWDPKRKTRAAYIHFQMSPRGATLPAPKTWPIVQALPDGDILRPLFCHIAWLMEHGGPSSERMAQGAARLFLMAFLSGDLRTHAEISSDLPQPVVRTLEYVQNLWQESAIVSPSLKELAKAAHVSRGHLCRLFKETLGCGPLQALRMLRVDRASELLARSNLQIQEVARLSGFENPFHFSRCFKEAFGLSPRSYRQKAVHQAVTPHTRLAVVRKLIAPRWNETAR